MLANPRDPLVPRSPISGITVACLGSQLFAWARGSKSGPYAHRTSALQLSFLLSPAFGPSLVGVWTWAPPEAEPEQIVILET